MEYVCHIYRFFFLHFTLCSWEDQICEKCNRVNLKHFPNKVDLNYHLDFVKKFTRKDLIDVLTLEFTKEKKFFNIIYNFKNNLEIHKGYKTHFVLQQCHRKIHKKLPILMSWFKTTCTLICAFGWKPSIWLRSSNMVLWTSLSPAFSESNLFVPESQVKWTKLW